MIQLLQKFFFAQAVDNRRDALRHAEEGEDDHSCQLFGLSLNKALFTQNREHEVHKVGQEVNGQLGSVQGDGPAPGPVAPVENPEPPALPQNPHVAIEDEQRAHADEEHLLQLSSLQLGPVTFLVALVVWLDEQVERDDQGQQPGDHPQHPGPVPEKRSGSV